MLAAISHLRDFEDDEFIDAFTDREFSTLWSARRALQRRLDALDAQQGGAPE